MRAKTAAEAASSRAIRAMTVRIAKGAGGRLVSTAKGVDDSSEVTRWEHKLDIGKDRRRFGFL